MSGLFFKVASVAAFVCAIPCLAEGDLSRVPQGATGREVMALMGEPVDRIERETKREQVWYYVSGSIVFMGGKARSIYMNGSNDDRFRIEEQRKMEIRKAAAQATPLNPVEDILSEILREVPSEPGNDGAAPNEVKPLEMR